MKSEVSFLRLVLLTVVFCEGCDPSLKIQGTVTIPTAVQAEFSDSNRGLVLFNTSHITLPRATLGVLCGPSAAPLEWPIFEGRIACAKEAVARILVVRATGELVQTCGQHRDFFPQRPEQFEVVARGEQPIFKGVTPRRVFCEGGDEQIAITVAKNASLAVPSD